MPAMKVTWLAATLWVAGCGAPSDRKPEAPDSAREDQTPPEQPDKDAAPGDAGPESAADPCGPQALDLGAAASLVAWKPPPGCAAKGTRGSVIIGNGEDLTARLQCNEGVEHGLDLSKERLLQVRGSMSPATIGWAAYDDGGRLTVVTKFRSPCPSDPRPMPMEFTQWFLVPADAERELAETTCTVKTKCAP